MEGSPTVSVHSVKTVADAPAEHQAAAGVDSSPPEADALEVVREDVKIFSTVAHGKSPVEEARDEPAGAAVEDGILVDTEKARDREDDNKSNVAEVEAAIEATAPLAESVAKK